MGQERVNQGAHSNLYIPLGRGPITVAAGLIFPRPPSPSPSPPPPPAWRCHVHPLPSPLVRQRYMLLPPLIPAVGLWLSLAAAAPFDVVVPVVDVDGGAVSTSADPPAPQPWGGGGKEQGTGHRSFPRVRAPRYLGAVETARVFPLFERDQGCAGPAKDAVMNNVLVLCGRKGMVGVANSV
jgi:hypothetical protein